MTYISENEKKKAPTKNSWKEINQFYGFFLYFTFSFKNKIDLFEFTRGFFWLWPDGLLKVILPYFYREINQFF